ncbi:MULTISPECIES: enoyl-CoA hydratase/isomerase family protein [unclassified Chelatococcus]|uniref:enoyl-CoA hydratase/isomerase family protein n=1 Tax=unclassified Chelatococcus TaxID=2638111 RepID=UPI001BCD6930|nr:MULTISPECIES: enoyl-CoA hydratase/isomerase family protein [unclassified Chelatococcus]MBS7701218.1 enoyl-CoA hydratase/isomerase family protein [Chelatococcus sp. YT9]MBX3557349.1 enoyl-CoA hydratase/isomerase family protein [Chelatococcus sp.]
MAKVIDEVLDRAVARIVLHDPECRNALDGQTRADLAQALQRLNAIPRVRAIVIGADRGNFSVGGDLSHVAEHVAGQSAHRTMLAVTELALQLHNSPKPLVAAVSGYCLGAGAGLALLCDEIVMARSATIGFPFLKLGVLPDCGITFSLPRRIGGVAARRALIDARNFQADDALASGLVDAVADDGALWNVALARARTLAEMPAHALLQLRRMLRADPATLPAALDLEALNQSICFGSEDLAEGLAAFREKRRPDFLKADGLHP